VEGDRDLVFAALEAFGLSVGEAGEALGEAVDLVVGEEDGATIFGVILLLTDHDAGGVVHHALDQHAAGSRHNDGGVLVLAHQHREAADVVQVAVGDDDKVDLFPAERGKIGGGGAAGLFRVQAAIDDDVQVTDLQEMAVGADPAVTVQIN
jgi:hypothetical protein